MFTVGLFGMFLEKEKAKSNEEENDCKFQKKSMNQGNDDKMDEKEKQRIKMEIEVKIKQEIEKEFLKEFNNLEMLNAIEFQRKLNEINDNQSTLPQILMVKFIQSLNNVLNVPKDYNIFSYIKFLKNKEKQCIKCKMREYKIIENENKNIAITEQKNKRKENQTNKPIQNKDNLNKYQICQNNKNVRAIPQKIIDLIIQFQVGSKSYYEKKLTKPRCDGEYNKSSGIQIGIGYDMAFVDSESFVKDWKNFLSENALNRLKLVAGKKGEAAAKEFQSVADIDIPWDGAKNAFVNRHLPKYQKMTETAFSGHEKLFDNAYGALVSLVYDVGHNTNEKNPRRTEMANIKKALKGQIKLEVDIHDYIAQQIRDMKRLWKDTKYIGLLKRRDREAQVVQQGKYEKKTKEEIVENDEQKL